MMRHFRYDERLGLPLPALEFPWEDLPEEEQSRIVTEWEHIRGSIPSLIMKLESVINRKQDLLYEEDDFAASCRLNGEIAELASRINDLQIWFRVDQDAPSAKTHG